MPRRIHPLNRHRGPRTINIPFVIWHGRIFIQIQGKRRWSRTTSTYKSSRSSFFSVVISLYNYNFCGYDGLAWPGLLLLGGVEYISYLFAARRFSSLALATATYSGHNRVLFWTSVSYLMYRDRLPPGRTLMWSIYSCTLLLPSTEHFPYWLSPATVLSRSRCHRNNPMTPATETIRWLLFRIRVYVCTCIRRLVFSAGSSVTCVFLER